MERNREFSPLAERCRPAGLEDFVGQRHLLSEGKIIHAVFQNRKAFSMILWGDPGTGKTTLARLIAAHCDMDPHFLSAISSGVADVRKVIDRGVENRRKGTQTLLFLDEIHRFNKAQQDAVLGAVESGDIVLIGATTENPSFQVISPLLSRTRVIRLERLQEDDLSRILDRALERDELLLSAGVAFDEGVREDLISLAQGDARRLFNILETAVHMSADGHISRELLKSAFESITVYYDRAGERHYDTISAFIKSLRGSEPNAAVYYLARMVLAGEDPVFIARRMVIFASEDVGNASPQALPIAVAAMTAAQNIGMPEAEIILAHCATFLASSPKSNESYRALNRAKESARDFVHEIPLHMRNAPTGLMKKMGYAKGYKYPHDYPGHFVKETYLPEEVKEALFYRPSEEGSEKALGERLARLWPEKYGKKTGSGE